MASMRLRRIHDHVSRVPPVVNASQCGQGVPSGQDTGSLWESFGLVFPLYLDDLSIIVIFVVVQFYDTCAVVLDLVV